MARGPRKLAITFGAQNLTHYGGIYLVHRFLTRIGFKKAVAQSVRVEQRNNRYSVNQRPTLTSDRRAILTRVFERFLGFDFLLLVQPQSSPGV